MSKSVIIIGGGIAGIASAVFLSEKGFSVSVYESSPKWGGRTFSYFDNEKNIFIDNGVHILGGFYKNTFEFMKIIGTFDKLKVKNNLQLVFTNKDKQILNFKCGNLPGVWSLLSGIFFFKGFNFRDKLEFLKIRKLINGKVFEDDKLERTSASKILEMTGQTENLMKYFWTPLIFAAFNSPPEYVSGKLLVNLLKKGTENKKNMSLYLGNDTLNGLFIDNSLKYLNEKSALLYNNLGGKKIIFEGNYIKCIELDNGETVSADYYISALPFYCFEKIFSPSDYAKHFNRSVNLQPSTIISVHLFFKNDISFKPDGDMTGLTGTCVQWLFVNNKRHVSLVISGADYVCGNMTELSNEEIYFACIKDLKSCLQKFDESEIGSYKIIKEKRATFLTGPDSEAYRLRQKSSLENLFIAGDWTDTGLPATIESAVTSAGICTDLIVNRK
ncbi:MAG: FAD-dependent oxidoreductase [Ignavibacteriae bacterium]|nr:FAD-dependent oxidoreductase [Ignavibacteriota bacterium]